jgi:hypothetical protein
METHTTDAAMGAFGIVIFGIFAVICLVALVCAIKVLIALFKKEGVGLGILGLLCGPFLYIWGWMKSKELGLKKTMIVWTLSIIGLAVLWFVAIAGAIGMAAMSPEGQKAIKDAQEAQQRAQQQQAAPAPAPAPQN